MDTRKPVRAALRLERDLEASFQRITRIVPKVTLLQLLLDGFLRLSLEEQMQAVGRYANGGEAPATFTHEVTRILDPELTPRPGNKASDRSPAKRSA